MTKNPSIKNIPGINLRAVNVLLLVGSLRIGLGSYQYVIKILSRTYCKPKLITPAAKKSNLPKPVTKMRIIVLSK
jgi:hypothetical protein